MCGTQGPGPINYVSKMLYHTSGVISKKREVSASIVGLVWPMHGDPKS